MSVGIRLQIESCPLLIGDILISSPEAARALSVPSIGGIEQVFPKGSGFVPTGLLQKVIAWGNFALTWAGNVVAARSILRDLWEQNVQTPFNYSTLREFFLGVDPSLLKEVQFVGFVSMDGRMQGDFGIQSKETSLPQLGRVGIVGSGHDYAIKCLEKMALPPIPAELSGVSARDADAHRILRAIGVGLSMTGAFVGHEIHTGGSLNLYFGGGYEIAVWADGYFAKLPEATFLYWSAQKDKAGGVGFSLNQISKFQDINDFLVIRTAVLGRGASTEFHLQIKSRVNVVPPINKWLSEFPKNVPLPAFRSDWLCNYIVTVPLREEPIFCNAFRPASPSAAPIRFIESGQSLVVSFRDDFLKSLVMEFKRSAAPK